MDNFTFDAFEESILEPVKTGGTAAVVALHKGFTSAVKPENGVFLSDVSDEFTQVRKMYEGTVIDGQRTLGLKALGEFKVNPEFAVQNVKQQAGFAAEIISTAKENIQAMRDSTGITTFRADDRPDLFPKNDQYVDKIRVDSSGRIVETIQSKFVGGDGRECASKLLSSKFDKYFTDGKVDKIEIPSDYFNDALQAISDKASSLQRQLERVTMDGKVDVAEQLQKRIDRCNQLEGMLQKSVVSSDEAIYARLHPKRYAAKMFTKPTLEASAKFGLTAAALTAAVSAVDNVRQCLKGDISPRDALVDVAKDTGIAGGTAFVSTTVASAMGASGHKLISSMGKLGVPAAVISFGVQSFDCVVDFAQGEIDGKELAHDLGENAVAVGGGFAGGVLLTAGIAAAAGVAVAELPVVTAIAAGLVGGIVGCALASEAYATIVEHAPEVAAFVAEKTDAAAEFISETAETLKVQAENAAREVVDLVKKNVPEKVEDIRTSFNDFFADTRMAIHI